MLIVTSGARYIDIDTYASIIAYNNDIAILPDVWLRKEIIKKLL